MRRLIINADDLGYSEAVNLEIAKAISKEAISSTTIMANGPAFIQGIEIAKENPKISVGVHLNLIEFQPLTNHTIFRDRGIIDCDGNFIEGAIFSTAIDRELKNAIYEEWDAQISKVIKHGIIPTHLDSHEHTHTIFALRDVLCLVLTKHNIRKVRRCSPPSIRLMLKESKKPSVKLDKSNAVQPPKKNIIYRRINLFLIKYRCFRWNLFMKNNFVTTNNFYAFRHFVLYRNIINLGSKSSVTELMCHPGQNAFDSESQTLMRDHSWLPNGYTLISYRDI